MARCPDCQGLCRPLDPQPAKAPEDPIKVKPWIENNPVRKGDWLVGVKVQFSTGRLAKWWRKLRGKE